MIKMPVRGLEATQAPIRTSMGKLCVILLGPGGHPVLEPSEVGTHFLAETKLLPAANNNQ